MSNTILQLDSSARINGSLSREATSYVVDRLAEPDNANVIQRDLVNTSLPLLTEDHIGAYFTPKEQRDQQQKELLKDSDALIKELKAADTLVIGAPIYNFSVPAALKAWIDLICRVGETFVYGENGPQGLLNISRAYIVVTAGGTPVGSEIDFNSAYLQQVCRFIGIDESHIIDVSGSKRDPQTLIDFAKKQVDSLIDSTAITV
ncbi:MAG: FMN-dependent NADH-azoreductase [Cellvibrionaceae bacterium]